MHHRICALTAHCPAASLRSGRRHLVRSTRSAHPTRMHMTDNSTSALPTAPTDDDDARAARGPRPGPPRQPGVQRLRHPARDRRRRSPTSASSRPSPSRSSPCRSRSPARTSSARPAPAPARRSASACRCSTGSTCPAATPPRRRRWSSPRPASSRCRCPATSPRPASSLGARVLTIYGGRAYEPQIEALRKGVDVVVGTPGRLLDLAQQGHLVLGNVRILVLDEADEMLDLGFLPDIEKLMKMLPDVAADDAVLGDHARPDRRAGPHLPQPADADPRRVRRRAHQHRPRRPVRLPRPRAWTRSRCSPACCRPATAA